MALFLLPVVVALVLLRRHQLDNATVAVFVSLAVGLPGLWLAWATYREARRPLPLDMAQVADQLAVAVGAQWEAEASMRRLHDPYPLPVSWAQAEASLTDSWDLLVKLAGSGAGWPAPPAAGTWATGPDDLAGAGGDLVKVLGRVPTGRLVVLGEPGAGKTMLMVRLVLDLLARRTVGGPVPILASVGSWNPVNQDLRDWLAAQLIIDHPDLGTQTGKGEPTLAATLLASGLILPVLDGLDEIPDAVRGPAISRINDALRPGQQLVVTCRSQQYQDTVRPKGGVEITLRAAAAVQLHALDAQIVRGYLCDDAPGPVAKSRWDPVFALLGTETPTGQALETPLMVGLARAIYNPRPGEFAEVLRDPAELCNPILADRSAVESLLFDAFIPAAYRNDFAGAWKAQDAKRWLVFLARHLDGTIVGPDLAWWQLPLAVPGSARVARVLASIMAGVAAGVAAGVVAGVVAGVAAGVAAAVLAWVVAASVAWTMGPLKPAPAIRWWPPITGSLAVTVFVACALAALGIGLARGFLPGLVMVAVGVGSALQIWVVGQARLESRHVGPVAGPTAVLARDRKAGAVLGGVGGIGNGLWAWFLTAIMLNGLDVTTGIPTGAAAGAGIAISIATGIAATLGSGVGRFFIAAWPCYTTVRIWLALRHRLPWSLMGFLADAHDRGVLRQAGAVYQFQHIELQHRLANATIGKTGIS